MMLGTLVDTIKAYYILCRLELSALGEFSSTAARNRQRLEVGDRSMFLLAPFLPPFDNGGVYRPLSWLEYAKTHGWNVITLTRAFKDEASDAGKYLLKRLPSGGRMFYFRDVLLYPCWSLFPRTDGSFLNAVGSVLPSLNALRDTGVTAVTATGPSFDVFISAFYIARILGAKLVLDYRDEWTLSPFKNVQLGNADAYWEARCLRAADLVLFTTKSMMERCQQHFGEHLKNKARVLPNGWEPDDLDVAIISRDVARDKLNVLYAGTMGHATLPGPFLSDLEQVFETFPQYRQKILVEVIGYQVKEALDQLKSFKYRDNLAVKGRYAKDVANAMIRNSAALLLFVNEDMARYIPGKVYEYIASGKPILVHGESGEVPDIIASLNAGIFVRTGDTGSLEKALAELLTSPHEKWQNEARQKWALRHTRENLASLFYSMIENI